MQICETYDILCRRPFTVTQSQAATVRLAQSKTLAIISI